MKKLIFGIISIIASVLLILAVSLSGIISIKSAPERFLKKVEKTCKKVDQTKWNEMLTMEYPELSAFYDTSMPFTGKGYKMVFVDYEPYKDSNYGEIEYVLYKENEDGTVDAAFDYLFVLDTDSGMKICLDE